MESTIYTVAGKTFELQHHGVKGMRWGRRRYQNRDGSLTAEGKRRYNDGSDASANTGTNADEAARKARSKKIRRRVIIGTAAGIVMGATVAAGIVYYKKNPEKVKANFSKIKNSTVSGAKKTGLLGKEFISNARVGAKEGIMDGAKGGAKKAAEAIITGATMMATKRFMDRTIGKEESARIFQANNKKKIGSFWKVAPEDEDDD